VTPAPPRRRQRHLVAGTTVLALSLAGGAYAWSRWAGESKEATFQVQGAVPASGAPFALSLYQSLGVRLMPGHQVSLIDNGNVFDVLVEQIARARSSVHVLMYIWEQGAASDRVVAALVDRARAGVACRIVVDDFGSPDFDETVKPSLTTAGCEVRTFRPLPRGKKLSRNHRKLVVTDGSRAITGGFGIRDSWLGDGIHEGKWRDTSVLFSGPAVSDAQQAFAENWQETGGTLLPNEAFPPAAADGPASAVFVSSTGAVVTRAERLIQLLIASARQRIWIANAYFVPSHGILELLIHKAAEGLDVRILAPGKTSDSKTAFGVQHFEYGALTERGARVWEYTASMMHAKTMVVDDELALVGSINLDPLSLAKLEEGALVVRDRTLATQMSETFTADCARSRQIVK
jgi:cardiolipin synthase